MEVPALGASPMGVGLFCFSSTPLNMLRLIGELAYQQLIPSLAISWKISEMLREMDVVRLMGRVELIYVCLSAFVPD